MIEMCGDLWTAPADYRIIPTNGIVNYRGHAVMGKGVAADAVLKFPMLPVVLGQALRRDGNHVHLFEEYKLLTFPTKHRWQDPASVELINRSVRELRLMINPMKIYAIPRVGCGEGRLDYATQVRSLLLALPDNVKVITPMVTFRD